MIVNDLSFLTFYKINIKVTNLVNSILGLIVILVVSVGVFGDFRKFAAPIDQHESIVEY